MGESKLVVPEEIQSRIYTIRGIQVMLDEDLAGFYGVEVKRLNEQVKHNIERFPEEFMFQLSAGEYDIIRSQNATIEHSFQKETLNFSKSGTASGRHRMKLRSNLLRNIEEIEAELGGVDGP